MPLLAANTAVLVGVFTFAASVASKAPCMGGPYDQSGYSTHMVNVDRLACNTDIQFLWSGRGIDQDWFPYVNGWLDTSGGSPGSLLGGAMEYPVIQGVFMWLGGLPADNSTQFLLWSAALLLPVAIAIAWMLDRMIGRRALIWAAAPAIVFYAAYNWDLLPVAWTVGAIYLWYRKRPTWAGVFLGLGAATKIYPGIFLIPLVIERWMAKDRPGAAKVAAAGGGSWLAVNLPFMLINFDGWWATYEFQAERLNDAFTNSIWFWSTPTWDIHLIDLMSTTIIAVLWVLAMVLGYWFRSPQGHYPWLQVGAAMLFAFLAFNKVYSPQYFLWVLPFLALIRFGWGWWTAYFVIDATLFVGIFRWYHTGSDFWRQAAMVGAYGKTLFFAVFYHRPAWHFDPYEARSDSPNARGVPGRAQAEGAS